MVLPIVEQFQSVYQRLNSENLDLLGLVYAPEVHFVDPVHEIHGLPALRAYCADLYRNVASCRFDYTRTIEQGDQAVILWTMHLRSRSFRPGETIALPGSSWIHFEEKIVEQRDHFDLGALVYERVPILGTAVRLLKRRLAGAAS